MCIRDSSSIKLLENPLIAFAIAWESYPMTFIIIALIITVYVVWKQIDQTFDTLNNRPRIFSFGQNIIGSIFGGVLFIFAIWGTFGQYRPVSYTHLSAHENVLALVCRLLLEKEKEVLELKQVIF